MGKITLQRAPLTGSTRKGDPDYDPFGQMYTVKLNGLLANGRNYGIAVLRYNIPQGWVEGRPADPRTGVIHRRAPLIRRYGVVTVDLPH